MTDATVSRTRSDSAWEAAEIEAQRWLDAAQRAVDNGIQIYQLDSCGSWIATSGSRPRVAHRLDVSHGVCHGCSCLGHDFIKVCQHRAAYYIMTGVLTAPEPTPKNAQPVPAANCGWCAGTGRAYSGYWFDWRECDHCDGSGSRTAYVSAQ